MDTNKHKKSNSFIIKRKHTSNKSQGISKYKTSEINKLSKFKKNNNKIISNSKIKYINKSIKVKSALKQKSSLNVKTKILKLGINNSTNNLYKIKVLNSNKSNILEKNTSSLRLKTERNILIEKNLLSNSSKENEINLNLNENINKSKSKKSNSIRSILKKLNNNNNYNNNSSTSKLKRVDSCVLSNAFINKFNTNEILLNNNNKNSNITKKSSCVLHNNNQIQLNEDIRKDTEKSFKSRLNYKRTSLFQNIFKSKGLNLLTDNSINLDRLQSLRKKSTLFSNFDLMNKKQDKKDVNLEAIRNKYKIKSTNNTIKTKKQLFYNLISGSIKELLFKKNESLADDKNYVNKLIIELQKNEETKNTKKRLSASIATNVINKLNESKSSKNIAINDINNITNVINNICTTNNRVINNTVCSVYSNSLTNFINTENLSFLNSKNVNNNLLNTKKEICNNNNNTSSTKLLNIADIQNLNNKSNSTDNKSIYFKDYNVRYTIN